MAYRISRKTRFSASHQLDHLPDGHKCKRLHGHNYEVTLFFERNDLDNYDFVRDFDSLSDFDDWINAKFDHRHLNDVLVDLANPHTQPKGAKPLEGGMDQRKPIAPTSENIARYIFDTWIRVWKDLARVRVSEGSDTWAEYSIKTQQTDPDAKQSDPDFEAWWQSHGPSKD